MGWLGPSKGWVKGESKDMACIAKMYRRRDLRIAREVVATEGDAWLRSHELANDQQLVVENFRQVIHVAIRAPGKIAMLLGPGDVLILGKFFRMTDQNMHQKHVAFVARRADGTMVTFYASAAMPNSLAVAFDTNDCATLGIRGEQQADAVPPTLGSLLYGFPVYHIQISADVICGGRAEMFIHNAVLKWRSRVNRNELFWRSLCESDSDFLWELYLAGTAWGQQIRAAGVASFILVSVGLPDDGMVAGFYVEYGDGKKTVIFPVDKCANEDHVGRVNWKV
jgi:hypothetical protein